MNCPNCNADDLKHTDCGSPACPQRLCRECEWGCDYDVPHGRCATAAGEQLIAGDWNPDIRSAVEAFVDSLTSAANRERSDVVRTGAREPVSRWLRRAIFIRDGFRCQACTLDVSHERAHLDHIIPWSAGGSDRSDNLRVLCEPCNENRSNFRGPLDLQRVLPIASACRRCMPDLSLAGESSAWCAICRRPGASDGRFLH